MTRAVRVLSVCTSDGGGGAERVARDLHEHYRGAGLDAWLAVGRVRVGDAWTREIPNRAHRSTWARGWMRVADALPSRGAGFHAAKALRGAVAEPGRWWRARRGEEDFDFPGTAHAFEAGGASPDVVHLHNLHGGYFDLRVLPDWSRRAPTVLSLHDAWMLSGHCAHPFGCEGWRTGCGACPALWIHPAVPRDATAFNLARKRDLYSRSALHVGVPCRWLATRVEESALAPAVRSMRVIPYGVNLDVYRPVPDKAALRAALGLDPSRPTFLVFANALNERSWKDGTTFRAALERVGTAAAAQWVMLGDAGPDVHVGRVRLRHARAERDDRAFARWYQAADAYVHPARADTFPLVNLEAQACGAAVIATAVDGIPEQVTPADPAEVAAGRIAPGSTAMLAAPGRPASLAAALDALATCPPEARARLGLQAAAHARTRFDRNTYRREYEAWLRDLAARPLPDTPRRA